MDGPQACHAAGGVGVVIIDQDRETFRRMHEIVRGGQRRHEDCRLAQALRLPNLS
jgi:hypothetical protein